MVKKANKKIYSKETNPQYILKNIITKLRLISFVLKKQKNKKAKNIELIVKKLESEIENLKQPL